MKNGLTIGVAPLLKSDWGGLYSYSDSVSRGIYRCSEQRLEHEFILFTLATEKFPLFEDIPKERWQSHTLFDAPAPATKIMDRLREFAGEGVHRDLWRKFRISAKKLNKRPFEIDYDHIDFNIELNGRLSSFDVDLMVYTNWSSLGFEAAKPFVMPIFDILHLTERERFIEDFGEVGEEYAIRREYSLRHIVKYATIVIAESEQGKENLLKHYTKHGATEDRIKVVSLTPASFLEQDISPQQRDSIRQKYNIPENYFFYPAQFWPHKNHANILEALSYLKKEKGFIAEMVFCGSANGEARQQYVKKLTELAVQLDVSSQVHFIGRADDDDMSGLYAGAIALVMPTFFGPTNIPPLEAWSFSCPVITSNHGGIDKEMGDAAQLVDPNSSKSIAEAMFALANDQTLRESLIARGRERIQSFTMDDYNAEIAEMLDEAIKRVRDGDCPSIP